MIKHSNQIIFAVLAVLTIGCSGGGGGSGYEASGGGNMVPLPGTGEPGSPSTPGGTSPVSITPPGAPTASRAKWDEKQGACLNSAQELAMNAEPIGLDAQCVDFSNQDLTGRDFSNYNLSGASFKNSVLIGVNFTGAILVGLVLDGAEVDSTAVMQWLRTGEAPKQITNGNQKTDNQTPVIISDDPTPTKKTEEPTPQDPILPNPSVDDSNDIADQLKDAQRISLLKQLEGQIDLASLKLQRQVEQSLDQINDLKLAEAKADLKNAEIAKVPDVVKEIKADIVEKEKEQQTIEVKVSDIVHEILDEAKDLKEQIDITKRIEKGLEVVNGNADKPADKMPASLNPIENQIDKIEREIADLTDSTNADNKTIQDQEQRLEQLTKEAADLEAQLQDLLKQRQELEQRVAKDNGSASGNGKKPASDQSSNKNQLDQVTKKIEEVTVRQQQVKHQQASLREQMVEPKKSRDQKLVKLHALHDNHGALVKELHDQELLIQLAKVKAKN